MASEWNSDRRDSAKRLNSMCHCMTLDVGRLREAVTEEIHDANLAELVLERGAAMFSNVAVFVSSSVVAQMADVVRAILRVTQNPRYREEVLGRAPPIARFDHGPAGVFMGFDFHVSEQGPQLIEINTNAGGAFLNAVLGQAHRRCCSRLDANAVPSGGRSFATSVVEMFEREWNTQRTSKRPSRLAIVDDRPQAQGLYPEFLLAQALFRRSGIEAVIAGPEEFTLDQGRLMISGERVDLVYNRLVDFDLGAQEHKALRLGYEMGAAVITPNPHNHVLYADKRNLVLFSDVAHLLDWGVEPRDLTILSRAVPKAHEVTPSNADMFWRDRRKYFFKPFSGYASKAVYRGDKLTSTRWAGIRSGGYIAQEFIEPGERIIALGGESLARKIDVRLYTYGTDILLTAARLYQGQTTNMRTPGGGFAPLIVVDDGAANLTSCETPISEHEEKMS
jgi:hypothetical protein